MRTPISVLLAAATACTVVVSGSTVPARAVTGLPTPTLSPLPTVSVPVTVPVPTPVVTVPAPGPALPGAGPTPGAPASDGEDDSLGGGASGTESRPAAGRAGTTAAAGSEPAALAATHRERRADAATPMVAGTAGAEDLLDDEDSPQLSAASRDFLAADQGIADIARQRRQLAALLQAATGMAQLYRALGFDIATAEGASESMHERHGEVHAQWVAQARDAYVSGRSGAGDTAGLVAAALARLADGGTRAELRVGSLLVHRAGVRLELEQVAARYNETKHELDDASARGAALAAQRSTALQDVHAARGSEVALHQARLVESGQLGAQIRAASAALADDGSTVRGTGELADPLEGHITSPFGMRFHPILRYTKLHTGTDLAGGSSILAADDGRVIMTVASTAYGNFTVIDHGVDDGKRVTTAYAHQATFLVREGQAVQQGDQIGVVGSTGYATGPHLHFEVRVDGTVVDPEGRL